VDRISISHHSPSVFGQLFESADVIGFNGLCVVKHCVVVGCTQQLTMISTFASSFPASFCEELEHDTDSNAKLLKDHTSTQHNTTT
jgi:hypothetical protein